MVNIWLDDIRPAPDDWLWAKTAYECIEMLELHKVNILSLDHDLGNDEEYGTGYTVCKWIVWNDNLPQKVYLHTANPIGRENMYGLLSNYVETFELETKVYNGPEVNSWEESVAKSKELGYF